jgi:hypothetical protein
MATVARTAAQSKQDSSRPLTHSLTHSLAHSLAHSLSPSMPPNPTHPVMKTDVNAQKKKAAMSFPSIDFESCAMAGSVGRTVVSLWRLAQ